MPILTDLYDEFAPDYERTRVPRFRPFLKKLLQLYDTRPGSHVLDAGCGTGLAATAVAPRVGHTGHVLGVDTSEAMLEIARHKAHGFGFDQCVFIRGDISRLDAADNSFDVVICSFALWGEPHALFAEFYRVLKPTGALLAQNWDTAQDRAAAVYGETLRAYVTALPGERITQARAVYSKHRSDWAEINTPADYERLLRAVGFSSVSAQWFSIKTQFKNLDEFIAFQDVGAIARAEIAAMTPAARAEFHTAVRNALQPLETAHGVDQEWRAVHVIARK